MSIVKEEHKATLRKWHEELQEKRGERASLRRSTTVRYCHVWSYAGE